MPHAGADDGEGSVVVSGSGGPGMPGDVRGEGRVDAEHGAKALELTVVVAEGGLVLAVDVPAVFGLDERENVGRPGVQYGVLVYDLPGAGLYPYSHFLSGLFPGVVDAAVHDVPAAQHCNIHKGHSPGAVAEDKYVAGQVQRTGPAQVQLLHAQQYVLVDCSLAGIVHSRVDIPEWIALNDEPFFDGLVVDGPEGAHVEGYSVACKVAPAQPCAVFSNQEVVPFGHRDVPVPQECEKAPKGLAPVAGRSQLHIADQ